MTAHYLPISDDFLLTMTKVWDKGCLMHYRLEIRSLFLDEGVFFPVKLKSGGQLFAPSFCPSMERRKGLVRGYSLEIGNWKLEIGNWKLEIGN